MATTYTSNLNLQQSAFNDAGWDVPIRTNNTTLDGLPALGGLAVALKEVPSASLNVKVAAGSFVNMAGVITAYAGTASQALAASQTNYVYLTDAAVLTTNTTGFPAANCVPLATVVTSGVAITSLTDSRVFMRTSGNALLPIVNNMRVSTADTLTAHSGGGQGSGWPITAAYSRFTVVAAGNDSATLPASVAGISYVVINAAAANSMNIFPATGEAINALGANNAFALAAGKTVELYCVTAGQWHTILSA